MWKNKVSLTMLCTEQFCPSGINLSKYHGAFLRNKCILLEWKRVTKWKNPKDLGKIVNCKKICYNNINKVFQCASNQKRNYIFVSREKYNFNDSFKWWWPAHPEAVFPSFQFICRWKYALHIATQLSLSTWQENWSYDSTYCLLC